eukprot:GCRY01000892.1.p1 GENE.GCRY01000892.1~~GCRY01000892.1.p1  ORF type:complete len:342 (-),score=63.88 GCRY01000892.1:414-1352(-)
MSYSQAGGYGGGGYGGGGYGSGSTYGGGSTFGGGSTYGGNSNAVARSPASPGVDADSEYMRLNNEVINNIQRLNNNVNKLEKMINQIGSPKDTHDFRQKLNELIDKTKDLSKETGNKIKQFGSLDGGSAGENRQRKLQQQKVTNDFQTVLKRFAEASKLSAEKERRFVTRQRALSQKGQRPELVPYDEEEENVSLIMDQRRQQQEQLDNQIAHNEALIEEREEAISRIEQDVVEINQIFRDLGELVTEQGVMLDSIEANIVSTSERTGAATGELRKASHHQKKARKKMCYLLIMALLIGGGLIIFITMASKK